jgi:hypothetical protein
LNNPYPKETKVLVDTEEKIDPETGTTLYRYAGDELWFEIDPKTGLRWFVFPKSDEEKTND